MQFSYFNLKRSYFSFQIRTNKISKHFNFLLFTMANKKIKWQNKNVSNRMKKGSILFFLAPVVTIKRVPFTLECTGFD